MAVNTIFNQIKSVNGVSKVSNQQTTTKPEEKKPVSKAVVGASLVGLAALASMGIYLATKGKGKVKPQTLVDEVKNPTNNTQLEELQKKANDLKDKIRTDYLAKKETSMNEWKASEDRGANILQRAVIKKEHIETTKDCDKILDELFTGQMEHGMQINKNRGMVEDFSKKVQDKIQELSIDKDWIELRNWRRNHIRMKKDKTLRNNITADDRARRQLVDEVLQSKINGEPTEALKRLDLSVDDAIKMIKGENTEKVLMDLSVSKYGGWNFPEYGISPWGLKVKELFKHQGYDKYAVAKEQVNSWQNQVDLVKKQRKMISERLNNVAQQTRQSDDVKALKELNKQIAELKKQNR